MRAQQAQQRVSGHPAVRTIIQLAALIGGIVAVFELYKIIKGA